MIEVYIDCFEARRAGYPFPFHGKPKDRLRRLGAWPVCRGFLETLCPRRSAASAPCKRNLVKRQM